MQVRFAWALVLGLTTAAQAQDAPGLRGRLAGEAPGQAVEAVDWRARLVTPPGNDVRKVTLASTKTELAQAATAMGEQATTLSPDDVDALIEASRAWRNQYSNAPELRDALRRIARRHPDRAVRADAARAAESLERDAHLVGLRRATFDMAAGGKRGVEIWAEIARRSVDHHKARTDLTWPQKFDAVIADLAIVFNGPEARQHLETYEKTFGLLPGSDPNVDTMIRAIRPRDARLGYVLKHIDPTVSADFRRGFNDGSRNQVFHTNFFVLLGYAAAKHDGRIVNAVNLKHETLDHLRSGDGGSVPDWRASAAGLRIGDAIRRVRDGESNNRTPLEGLEAIPSIIGGAFSNHPWDFTRPWGRSGPNYTKTVRQVDAHIRATMDKPYGNNWLANNFQRGLIRLVRWIR